MHGRIDGVKGDVLHAWAWDPARPTQRLIVRLIINGHETNSITADKPRKDLLKAGIGDGCFGVQFGLDTEIAAGGPLDVRLVAFEEVQGWTEIALRKVAISRPANLFKGRVERFKRAICVGWVHNVHDVAERVHVEALWGGKIVATAVADRVRKDLLTARIGDGRHGFEIPISATLLQVADLDEKLTIRVVDGPAIGTTRLPSVTVIKSLVNLARQAERDGKQAAAVESLDEVLRLSSGNVDALWLRARIASEQGDVNKASQLAKRALELHPSHTRASVILARLAFNDERYEEALDFWTQVPEGDQAYRESLIKAARSSQRLGRNAEVIGFARKLLSSNPEDADGNQLMADAYLAVGASGLAVPYLRRISVLKPGDKRTGERLRLAALTTRPTIAAVPMEFLVNPTMGSWHGPAEGTLTRATEVARGVSLRPTNRRGAVSYRLCDPQEFRAGDPPHYGLAITAKRSPAELGFQLSPESSALLAKGLRVYVEVQALLSVPTRVEVSLVLRAAGRRDIVRGLTVLDAKPRSRLMTFDLVLQSAGSGSSSLDEQWMVLRLDAEQSALLRAPRPLMRLATSIVDLAGPEGTPASAYERIASMHAQNALPQ